MKKIILIILSSMLGFSSAIYADKLNLGNPKTVENLGANIIKSKLDTYDSVALGEWFLRKNYRSKYDRVRNDEFEFDDAKVWAFEQLKKKLNNVKPVDKNSEYHIYLSAEFQKYDFKSKTFPITALSEGTYMQYKGKGEFVEYYSSSKLEFENIDSTVNIIPMEKADAKKFIKSRKNKYGSIDRNIIAHYVYTITNFSEEREFTSDGSPMVIKFVGKLKSVEFMDKKRKNVLHSVSFEHVVNNIDKNSTNH